MVIVTIRRPELAPEERARRTEQIKRAAVDLVTATEKHKKKNNIGGKRKA